MIQTDANAFFNNIPPITRYLIVAILCFSLACNFNVIPTYSFLLIWKHIRYDFELWRLFTSLLYSGPLGFPFLTNLYLIYQYSSWLEKEEFSGRKADFVFMLIIIAVALMVLGLNPYYPAYYLATSLSMALTYICCQLNKDAVVTFYFSIALKAVYLPWALLLFYTLLGDPIRLEIIGMISGHCYYFLQYIYPQHSGTVLLTTPKFLKKYFSDSRISRVQGVGVIFRSRTSSAGESKSSAPQRWEGEGRVLGSK
jgi:derlin-1